MSTSPHTTAVDTIDDLNANALARMADVSSPDTLGSPGAEFLSSVRDSLVEWVECNRDDYSPKSLLWRAQEDAFMQVDANVPVYTHSLWKTFVDLCAYNDESADEFGDGTPTEQASYILARIAERLFVALAEEYGSAYENAQDEALGECDTDENGECSGACVTRPHLWSASGARCIRSNCNVVGSGDQCGDGNCEGDD